MDLAGISEASETDFRSINYRYYLSGTGGISGFIRQGREFDPGKVLITDKLDRNAEEALKKGGSVLLLTYGKVGKTKGAQVAIGFSSIFWNTAWTNNQPPHTLGILCDPENPLFSDFPTEYHSNWQWWDPVTTFTGNDLNGFPAELKTADSANRYLV